MSDMFRGRGVRYFDGRVRCPLAGVGTRGDFASNRLAVEDERSTVAIDRAAARIAVRHDAPTTQKTCIADLTFLADATTRTGARTPVAVHLELYKRGTRLHVDLHRHLRRDEPLVDVALEPFTVTCDDGRRVRTVLTPEAARSLVISPSLTLRMVKALMAMHDEPSDAVADLSVGLNVLGWRWMMARAELRRLDGNAAAASVASLLADGDWELRLTARAGRALAGLVRRDLFLFGLDGNPALREVAAGRLRDGDTLVFRLARGRGEVGVGTERAPLDDALDVARAYLEFHMLGGLLVERAERRLTART